MECRKLERRVQMKYGKSVHVNVKDGNVVLSGTLDNWNDIISACMMCVDRKRRYHVINDIKLKGVEIPKMRLPKLKDDALEGKKVDVLVIGGGISGASIARELMKWNLKVLLVEKESDLAMQASGRNDGEVHPGVDLNKGSLKQHYVLKGNQMYGKICRQLDVPFKRCGQYVGMLHWRDYPAIWLYAMDRKYLCGVKDTRVISGKELKYLEPNLNQDFKFALYNPSAGSVCPYGLTIAYAENAVTNGAEVSLNTAVLSMEVEKGKIRSVLTNRGRVYPTVVINAAGTFAEDIAAMAGDRFYSIHPRKGTNSILDKKAGKRIAGIASWKTLQKTKGHTKGGGVVHTVHDNLLIGPDAIETYEKENFATERKSIDATFKKQSITSKEVAPSQIITYFTGVRAATFEEDFVIESGRKTKNLIHCAGIQSPGLTTAPAVAKDVSRMAAKMVSKVRPVRKNPNYNPYRKGIPVLREMEPEVRDKMIKMRPDYGVIVCRCEEISRGEIIDALKSPIVVPTVDAIKKRVRPGMGRCQGGFCMPTVAKIISDYTGVPLAEVTKSGNASQIVFGETKEGGSR